MTVMSFEWPPVRTFRAWAQMEKPDGRLRPSMNGRMDVVIQRLPDAISIPVKALYTLHGKPVVYVAGQERIPRGGGRSASRAIRMRSQSRALMRARRWRWWNRIKKGAKRAS